MVESSGENLRELWEKLNCLNLFVVSPISFVSLEWIGFMNVVSRFSIWHPSYRKPGDMPIFQLRIGEFRLTYRQGRIHMQGAIGKTSSRKT